MNDPVALADQAVEEVKQAARIIATLYMELCRLGVPAEDAHWFARDYADAMWTGQGE